MKWIYGFFLAWGMFLAIPCPLKLWDEKARRHMLVCLPLVGLLVGAIWGGTAWLLRDAPAAIRGLLLAIVPWICTGFLHLDCLMDVCDAVLSRRDLATRQKILKDSHCGAFAVIGVVLLMLGQWSVFYSAQEICWYIFPFICMAVRACAGMAVMMLRPMGSSQYAGIREEKKSFCAALLVLLLVAIGLPLLLWGSMAPAAAAAGYWLMALYGYRQLDGMNGDISGFALSIAELVGAAVLVFVG